MGYGIFGDAIPQTSAITKFYKYAAPVSMVLSVYHGYKRNQSIFWAVLWGLLGSTFPLITPGVAFAQGFGKRKK